MQPNSGRNSSLEAGKAKRGRRPARINSIMASRLALVGAALVGASAATAALLLGQRWRDLAGPAQAAMQWTSSRRANCGAKRQKKKLQGFRV